MLWQALQSRNTASQGFDNMCKLHVFTHAV